MRAFLFLALSLFLTHFSPTRSAHLPALRKWRAPQDEKRQLASKLLKSADEYKESSLRDVLHGAPHQQRGAERQKRRTVHQQRKRKEQQTNQQRFAFRSFSHLFAWAINNTVTGGRNVSVSVSMNQADQPVAEKPPQNAPPRDAVRVTGNFRALPSSKRSSKRRRPSRQKQSHSSYSSYEDLHSATESEYDIIKHSIRVLSSDISSSKAVRSLLLLEELCHSIDNGRDLQISGGMKQVVHALSSQHDTVRASAAWALATCCQNNPSVQNASLQLDAVPRLSTLAAKDSSSNVRSKALFALNAVLELEEARHVFESLPYATDVLRNSLVHDSDHRATRRALNLTELLVQRNLDAWKTQLEAYDIPYLIEKLMRTHPDIDVRESAARTIAALDGKPLS